MPSIPRLSDLLTQTRPRENSGARSSNRFDFQKDWALCHLLLLHSSQEDYALLLEVEEDILVLDSETIPSAVEFYQVKTMNSGNWTRPRLLHRPRGQDGLRSSILGKLYESFSRYQDHTKKVCLISNTSFKLDLQSNHPSLERDDISFADLSQDELGCIASALKAERGLTEEPDLTAIWCLRRTDLSLNGHATHAQGKLAEFLERMYPARAIPIPTLYRVLITEISRKTNSEFTGASFQDLVSRRGITRSLFQSILDNLRDPKELDPILAQVNHLLTVEGYSFADLEALSADCKKFEIDRMDPTNESLNSLRQFVKKTMDDMKERGSYRTLTQKLSMVVAQCRDSQNTQHQFYSDTYLKAMAILVQYEY